MQYFSDSQLDAMFRLLDFDQLEQMGYDLSMSPEGDLGDEDFLQSLLESIEEDFSGFDREQKIAELREVGAFDDDYLVSEVKMSAEEHKHCDGCEEVRIINDFSLSNAIDDKEQTLTQGEVCDYCFEDFYGAETKRQRMKREKEEAAMDEASTDVDYMREHYSESDAYIYAYNDGHTDSRGAVGYRPSATDRELTSFKKIFKQAEFAADSPFNTLLMIREDIIIDDEEDFDRLLSIYMSLETDIAQLYQETNNPKHPLLGEMMRYRNRIANRLDELQEEVAIQDTIEMDAEHRGTFSRPQEAIPVTLEKPIRTGYKIGLGWVAAALTIPLAIVGIGAFYNQE